MRQKIAIGILIVFCYSEIRVLLPFFDYFINYEYISQVLCINKDKPMSTCNGKCYLSEQLQESQDFDKNNKKILVETQERIPMIICNYDALKFEDIISTSKKQVNYYRYSIKNIEIIPPTPPPKC